MAEFLPLCDVLFNVISLAGYFCDVVFDLVMGYALLERGYRGTFTVTVTIVASSLIISQVVSLRWYLHLSSDKRKSEDEKSGRGGRWRLWVPVALHALQLGVLWRYARLFVPVDLRYVKHEVRNLCMLRLVHAFCEAAPMLLIQLHLLLWSSADAQPVHRHQDVTTERRAFTEVAVISASLSLFSVCWALASFSKNVRRQNVHRLVLTWLGVIFQFLWRLGTISARVTALTAYASLYEYWVFLVIGLHWVSMFLWLISPKNVFHGERISRPRKAYLSALIAFVYVFAYINLQEVNHRQKMVTFYCVMLVENALLVCLWLAGVWGRDGATHGTRCLAVVPTLVGGCFALGITFMLLYYRYFHVRRLGYEIGGRLPAGGNGDALSTNNNYSRGDQQNSASAQSSGRVLVQASVHNAAIPGVFNCRFTNPVTNSNGGGRKKKKPTTFVPPPTAPRPAPQPFWRRPLPASHNHHGGSSENEGSSVGSRVNIQQKLQEKKQKQLAELRVIEEEIKQGKLAVAAPLSIDEIYSSLQRQPIPKTKKHIDIQPLAWTPPSPQLTSLRQTFNKLAVQTNNSQSPKLYDRLPNANLITNQTNGYENFSCFPQNSNLVNQLLGGFSSYTELINPVNVNNTYESNPSPSNVNNTVVNNRNMSPTSQVSTPDQNNSLTKQIMPKLKNTRQYAAGITNMYNAPELHSRLLYSDNGGSRILNSPIEKNLRKNNAVTATNSDQVNSFFDNNTTRSNTTGSNGNSYDRPKPNCQNRLIDQLVPRSVGLQNVPTAASLYSDGQSRQFSYGYSGDKNNSLTSSELRVEVCPGGLVEGSRMVTCGEGVRGGEGKGFAYGPVRPPRERCEETRRPRCRTPEILLAPNYLEGCTKQACCHWSAPYRQKEEEMSGAGEEGSEGELGEANADAVRPSSDMDSQISLPRSYTLPREFRYWRRARARRPDHLVPSNNSSDGDVDSADDNESERRSHCSGRSVRAGELPGQRLRPRPHPAPKHETKL